MQCLLGLVLDAYRRTQLKTRKQFLNQMRLQLTLNSFTCNQKWLLISAFRFLHWNENGSNVIFTVQTENIQPQPNTHLRFINIDILFFFSPQIWPLDDHFFDKKKCVAGDHRTGYLVTRLDHEFLLSCSPWLLPWLPFMLLAG